MYHVPWSIKSHVISPSNLLSNILSHLDLQTAYRDITFRDATAYSLHIFHTQIPTVLSISLNFFSYFSFFPQSQTHAPFSSLAPSLSPPWLSVRFDAKERGERRSTRTTRGEHRLVSPVTCFTFTAQEEHQCTSRATGCRVCFGV